MHGVRSDAFQITGLKLATAKPAKIVSPQNVGVQWALGVFNAILTCLASQNDVAITVTFYRIA